jgi:hypothetical protein
MKLSSLKAKLTGIQSKVVRVLAVTAVAGAALAVAAPAAQAQRVFVRVGPRYVAPARRVVVVRPDFYYGGRHEVVVRHEEWARAHRYGYGRR